MYHNVTSLSPVGHYDNHVCTDCHPHKTGFPSFTTVWNPMKRWFSALLGTDSAYAKPPAWVTDGALPPGLTNHSLPDQVWENGQKKQPKELLMHRLDTLRAVKLRVVYLGCHFYSFHFV